ncbi:uncharacterized protein LOC143059672 [Mytilus galloprovincialis]|uniref:uncharacterized protein LOC143059672 n=1 Tax=Mytilus galloprovincialis TaxID=29158 RepID=UPI003F7C0AA6
MNGNGTSQLKLKVVLVGDAAVGKTSLSVRFTEDKFGDNYRYTIGGSYCTRSLYVANKKIMFQIWDTAGTERFKSIVPFYLRDADVAIVGMISLKGAHLRTSTNGSDCYKRVPLKLLNVL